MVEFVLIRLIFSANLFGLLQGDAPGAFFWKPRLALDLQAGARDSTATTLAPDQKFRDDMKNYTAVCVEGFSFGASIAALVENVVAAPGFEAQDPGSAAFYNNAYRWFLRHMSLYPDFLRGNRHQYSDTHKVWERRFYYNDRAVPTWLRWMNPFVDWGKQDEILEEFQHNLPLGKSFGDYYKYPDKNG